MTAEVKQAVRDWNNATDINQDVDATAKTMSDDFVHINGNGEITDKAALLAIVKSGDYEGESVTFDNEKVRVYGDTAVFTARFHFKGAYQGSKVDVSLYATSVWVKRDGTWQLVSVHESNPIP
jgi:ketosteroid isomerase-like protein